MKADKVLRIGVIVIGLIVYLFYFLKGGYGFFHFEDWWKINDYSNNFFIDYKGSFVHVYLQGIFQEKYEPKASTIMWWLTSIAYLSLLWHGRVALANLIKSLFKKI